jgi:hypothetical protein
VDGEKDRCIVGIAAGQIGSTRHKPVLIDKAIGTNSMGYGMLKEVGSQQVVGAVDHV